MFYLSLIMNHVIMISLCPAGDLERRRAARHQETEGARQRVHTHPPAVWQVPRTGELSM